MNDQVLYQSAARPINPMDALTVKVTRGLIIFERGKFSTSTQQVPLAHVVDVDASQSMTQKARNVGSVIVHVQRANGQEKVVLGDMPDHQTLHACINDLSRQARAAEQRARQTQHWSGPMHTPSAPPQPAPPQPVAPQEDVLAQLERLGKLRDAGVVTPEEFEAKKREMLARL